MMIREDASSRGGLTTLSDAAVRVVVASASVVVNAGLVAGFGVRRGGDTYRYLASASDLVTGRPFRGQGGWVYFGYNGLVALCQLAGVGERAVVGVHIAVAALAAV